VTKQIMEERRKKNIVKVTFRPKSFWIDNFFP
jgi:hypothetical protein